MQDNILDTIDLVRLGKELQIARKRARLTQEQAAEILQVARTTITAIESGQRRLKASELVKLARAYNRKVNDFVRPHPEVESFEPQFRAVGSMTTEDIEKVSKYVYKLEDLARNYYELEQVNEIFLSKNYPTVYNIDNLEIEDAAEDLALFERNRLNLGDAPIFGLRNLLELNVGLRIFYLDITPSNQFCAIYIYDNTLGGCIAINRLHSPERQLFSLAHDYAHFLAHRYNPDILLEDSYRRLRIHERFADLFAVYFLMPTSSVKRQIANIKRNKSQITTADLLTLADYFHVSVQAIVQRLEGMQEVRSGTWDKIIRSGFNIRNGYIQLGLRTNEEVRESMLPVRYQNLALSALEQELISEGRFARYMETDLVDANRIADAIREVSSDENS